MQFRLGKYEIIVEFCEDFSKRVAISFITLEELDKSEVLRNRRV
jgi:hypothetical protein